MKKRILLLVALVALVISVVLIFFWGKWNGNQYAEITPNFFISVFINLAISSFVAFLAFYEGQQSVKEAERGDAENAIALIEGFESDAKIILLKSTQRIIEKLQKNGKEKIVKAIEELGRIPMESQQVQRTVKGEYVKRAGEFRVIFIKTKDKIIVKDILKR